MSLYELKQKYSDVKDIVAYGGWDLCKGCKREKQIDCKNWQCWKETEKRLNTHHTEQISLF